MVYWNSICCVIMSREVTVTTPPSRSPRAWNGEGEVLGVVPLLCAQGREEEASSSPLSARSSGAAPITSPLSAQANPPVLLNNRTQIPINNTYVDEHLICICLKRFLGPTRGSQEDPYYLATTGLSR